MHADSATAGAAHSASTENLPTAIILAGGLSKRMGFCKQLHPLCGKPLVQYVLETLLEAGISHLVITVNAVTQRPIETIIEKLTETALQGSTAEKGSSHSFHCDIVLNPEPERGQGYSAALAAHAACTCHRHMPTAHAAYPCSPSGFLFCTADQPFLTACSLRKLCAVFRRNPNRIVSAAFHGKHRSPVIFPASLTDDLTRLDGTIGGRAVMRAHETLIMYSPLHHEMEAFDIDTPEDFNQAERYLRKGSCTV